MDQTTDPAKVPLEIQPGVFEDRFQRYELGPGFNEACIWRVKSGSVQMLSFTSVFSTSLAARNAIAEIGLNYQSLSTGTAAAATAAIEAAIAWYTTKQRADWWKRVLPFFGQVYDPADDYVPIGGSTSLSMTAQGTKVVRGPFSTPRHTLLLRLSPTTGSSVLPATVDVLIGCNDDGESPVATLRLRVEHGTLYTQLPRLSGNPSLASHVFALPAAGPTECRIVLEVLDSSGSVIESREVRNFPNPHFPQALVSNNGCRLQGLALRVAVTNKRGLRIEAILNQLPEIVADGIETGAAEWSNYGPPIRHLFEPIPWPSQPETEYDISRIGVAMPRATNLNVEVSHRPLERNDEGSPEFYDVPQGGGCADSDEAKDAMRAGEKTVCTAWSRQCHVSHSSENECFTELDVEIAGTANPAAGGLFSYPDLAAVLQGAFTLANLAADGAPLMQNTFWFADDTDVTVGTATRKRIEISAVIGAHWPVPVCIGSERPVEIALFARANFRTTDGGALPFPFAANVDYSIAAALRARVSQRLLLGQVASPSVDDYYTGVMHWDLDFPWGTAFWQTATQQAGQANAMHMNLTTCRFQLQ